MNQGDTVQIEAPNFDPDIDGVSSPSTDEKPNKLMIQGTLSPTPEVTELEDDNSLTPATTYTTANLSRNRLARCYPCANPMSLFIDSPARRTRTHQKPGQI